MKNNEESTAKTPGAPRKSFDGMNGINSVISCFHRVHPVKKYSLALLAPRRFILLLALSGCASPPSVVPLLRVAQSAMESEKSLLAADLARQRAWLDAQRASLDAAFDADLRQRQELDPAWVREGTRVYAAAREQLARHRFRLEQETHLRSDNLDDASLALDHAAGLIEQQDQLLDLVPELRRVLIQHGGTRHGGQARTQR